MRIWGMLIAVVLGLVAPAFAAAAQDAGSLRATEATTPEMLALDARASTAIEAQDWVEVEATLRLLLPLELVAYGPDDPRVSASHSWMATAIRLQGRPIADYEGHLRERLRIAEAHLADRDSLGAARAQLAYALAETDRPAEAVPLFEGAIEILSARSPVDADLLTVRNSLADALSATDRKPEALVQLRAVLDAVKDGDDASIRAAAANRLAVRLYELSRYAEAEPVYRVELDARTAAGGADAPHAATAAYWLAETLKRLEREAETEPLLARILEMEGEASGPQRLLTDDQVARSAVNLGILRHRAGRIAEAEAPFRTAVALRRREPVTPSLLFPPVSWLGLTLRNLDRPAEAEPVLVEAVRLAGVVHGENDPAVAVQLFNLGSTYMDQYKYIDGLRILRRAVTIDDAVDAPNIRTIELLGTALNRTGLYQEAETVRRRALGMRLAEEPANPVATGRARLNLAGTLYAQERYIEAEAIQQQALRDADNARVRADGLTDLAMTTHNLGRTAAAEDLFRDALAATEQAYGASDPATAGAMLRLGQTLGARGDWARADPLLARAAEIATASNDRILLANAHLALGAAFSDSGRSDRAMEHLALALRIRRELFGGGHPDTVNVVRRLALEMVERGQYAEAERYLRSLVEVRERGFGPNHPQTADALQELALAIFMQDRFEEAIPLMRRALAIMETDDDPRSRIRFGTNLGVTMIRAEQPDQALVVLRAAARLLLERVGGQATGQDGRSDLNGLRYLFRNSVRAAWDASMPLETGPL
ncbi:hypothetical protein KOAAANKH_03121 [Brevundimonas sp. NIBR10]|uniref:tetratricopeptide repeat protein n=1 Tax=Brevundimonas sp. NIBR10 TaxID=3015997 RepID=UPI0022F1A854|nr:tetratricopeptide repeat protein [Brevundimonas sp. NIBR10]WGM48225.1 hypothetical protein KOAAANKH_03121 [Brevundimonas sp. NIBR10]